MYPKRNQDDNGHIDFPNRSDAFLDFPFPLFPVWSTLRSYDTNIFPSADNQINVGYMDLKEKLSNSKNSSKEQRLTTTSKDTFYCHPDDADSTDALKLDFELPSDIFKDDLQSVTDWFIAEFGTFQWELDPFEPECLDYDFESNHKIPDFVFDFTNNYDAKLDLDLDETDSFEPNYFDLSFESNHEIPDFELSITNSYDQMLDIRETDHISKNADSFVNIFEQPVQYAQLSGTNLHAVGISTDVDFDSFPVETKLISQVSVDYDTESSCSATFIVPRSPKAVVPPKKRKALQLKKVKKRYPYKRPNYEPVSKEYVDPTDDDVLLGRGGRANNHPGNQKYLIETNRLKSEYVNASKESKTVISQRLVDIVSSWNGRFLKQDLANGQWYIVLNIAARKKASQALRDA